MLRWGSGEDISGIFDRFVVKARARDIFAEVSFDVQKDIWPCVSSNISKVKWKYLVWVGEFRLDLDRVYGRCREHLEGSSSGPISLAGDQTLSFFTPVTFRNQARLVLKSESQPVIPLV
jgi:hypothetical protein